MEWIRGDIIGKGSFGTVSRAIPTNNSPKILPSLVVKSAPITNSTSLHNEKQILSHFQNCPEIIQCYGDGTTIEDGNEFYNLFLEYAIKGSLADQLKKKSSTKSRHGVAGMFTDNEVRRYTKSILRGLLQIHEKGFVHCDIKLQNVLLFDNDEVKIADFGLAKRAGKGKAGEECVLRGTPLYMSPEVVKGGESEWPADIWAVGCMVIEMSSGKSGWNYQPGCEIASLFYRIVVNGEVPEIPGSLCEEGKDFVRKCLVKDPKERWTARMLLDHPFIADHEVPAVDSVSCSNSRYSCCSDEDDGNRDRHLSVSPRCPFDFPGWVSIGSAASNQCTIISLGFHDLQSELDNWNEGADVMQSCLSRVRELASWMPDWSDSDEWIYVR